MTDKLRAALALYDLADAEATLLRDYENHVYRINAGQTYALRLCAPATNPDHLAAELAWLHALNTETSLQVPKPVPTRYGELSGKISQQHCVLFEWLEGKPLSMSPSVARKTGELTAQLHQHAVHCQAANGARVYDHNHFFGPTSWWQTKASVRLGKDFEAVRPAAEKLAAHMQALVAPQHFGMVHSDIHFGNLLHNNNGYALLDFGDCGLAHFLLDIAVTEAELRDYPEANTLIKTYREGYETVRHVHLDDAEIRSFGVAASLLYLEWLFESENEAVREDKGGWLPGIIESIASVG